MIVFGFEMNLVATTHLNFHENMGFEINVKVPVPYTLYFYIWFQTILALIHEQQRKTLPKNKEALAHKRCHGAGLCHEPLGRGNLLLLLWQRFP